MDDRLQGLIDRMEVTELLTRFHRAVDRNAWEMMRTEVLAPEAVWEWTAADASGSVADRAGGADSFVAWLSSSMTGSNVRHFTTSHLIEIEGDHAHSESYMVVVDTVTLDVLANGLLTADHVRRPEGWRMLRCCIDERIPDGMVETIKTLLPGGVDAQILSDSSTAE